MKYLALLKDSLLEAIDAKVFYVTIGLSCLLTLVVASISFQPLPAQEALQHIAQEINVVFRDRGRSMQLQPGFRNADYKITDLQQLTEGASPEACDYRFTLTAQDATFRSSVTFWNLAPGEDRSSATSAPVTDALMEEFVKSQFAMFGNLDVVKVHRKEAAQGAIAFDVETKGGRGVRGWQHQPNLLFGAVPIRFIKQSLGYMVYWIEDELVNGFGAWIGILIGVVVTAFFIPNMLRKGTIDLLLVKPIHRTTLLVYKYLGGLMFVFLNAAVAVGGMWLALGLRSGIWASGFLLTILVLTYFFAILYAVSTLFAVLTRSAIVAILVTIAAWFIFVIAGYSYKASQQLRKDESMNKELPVPEWVYNTIDGIHFVLPRTKDLDILTTKVLSREVLTEGELRGHPFDLLPDMTWTESLTVSGIFITVTLGLACLRFAWADY